VCATRRRGDRSSRS
jgi:hypothetical protein